jgi:Xaa-Pro aminopeptidase
VTVDALPDIPLPAVVPATAVAEDTPEHALRIAVLRQHMRGAHLAAVAVAGPENIYYLTGLDHLGYFAFTLLVVPAAGDPIIITRAMERPTIRAQVPWCRHVTFDDDGSAAAVAVAVLSDVDGKVALDDTSIFFPPAIALAIRERVAWVPGSRLLAALRAVKSEPEIGLVRRAAAASDLAMAAGLAALRPGVAERDVAADVYRTLIAAGGAEPGFPPLIRSTARLNREHVTWSDATVPAGQGVFLELSASVRRYHAPQSRTVYLGHAPDAAVEAAGTALAGLTAALAELGPGVLTGQVYAAWQRAVSRGAPPARPLRHHCGYLVGIGFPPSWVGGGEVLGIRAGGDVVVEAGMTFHLMSWVTEPIGHVVSDTVLVTGTGARTLTTTPREPIIL